MEKVYALLTAKDTKEALAKFNQLQTECLNEPIFADKLEQFLPALKTEASCGRGRTFKFFMINARWDTQGVQSLIQRDIEKILPTLII